MKRIVKKAIGAASTTALVRPIAAAHLKRQANVIYYHRVGPSTPYYAAFFTGCTLERFRRDLAALANTFEFASLAETIIAGPARAGRGKPLLTVTFDDGFRLNDPSFLETLDTYGVKATTFLITGMIDNADLMWRNKLSTVAALGAPERVVASYCDLADAQGLERIDDVDQVMTATRSWPMSEKDALADKLWSACGLEPIESFLLREQPYFSWADLDQWRQLGHGVGLHTRTHPFCSRLSVTDLEHEIVEPASQLRSRLQLDVLPFSYPFGDRVDEETERQLVGDGVLDLLFGIDGLGPHAAPPHRLERAGVERSGVSWPVFGRTVASLVRDPRRTPAGSALDLRR